MDPAALELRVTTLEGTLQMLDRPPVSVRVGKVDIWTELCGVLKWVDCFWRWGLVSSA